MSKANETNLESSRAKEMFEELGYEYTRWEKIEQSIEYQKGTRLIVFDLEENYAKSMGIKRLSKKERDAIQQQKIELGWLDE